MAYGPFSLLLTRRFSLFSLNPKPSFFLSHFLTKPFSTSPDSNPKPSSLSARLSFVFDQIEAIEKERSQKHETLQRIRSWRESKTTQPPQNDTRKPESESQPEPESPVEANAAVAEVKKEVELVHPWPEWVQLMGRLVHQNYFDHRRRDEDQLVQELGFDAEDDEGLDFTKDFKSVHTACLNFGKDRFDILRSLSRQDIQILVGFGCPTTDKKVVFSAKLLRKHVHLDEGDVCSSCSLRNSCERAYLLTNKEDEARTIDVMRILLTFGFDPINESVINKSLLKQKSLKTVVRKLLHDVVKLSSVPIDPNLAPPVIKKPPPKVKQPPPTPKKRVGRDDVEMKKGDWLCPKCDFMNFAKNTICLQCDAKRPKRQLLPGEWECPECNFLNYRRNVVCFHCECKRPHDEFLDNKMQDKKNSFEPSLDKVRSRQEVSNAWNFDFDDNESDGADVAAFEYADAHAIDKDFPSDNQAQDGNFRGSESDFEKNGREQGSHDREYTRPGIGFDDFDDEDDIDSYELDTQTQSSSSRLEVSKHRYSEGKDTRELEENTDDEMHTRSRHKAPSRRSVQSRSVHKKKSFSESDDDELDFDSDEQSIYSNFKSGAGQKRKGRGPTRKLSFGSESDEDTGAGLYSDEDDDLDETYSSRKNKGNKYDLSGQNKGNNRLAFGRRNFAEDRKSSYVGGGRKANTDGSSRKSYRNGRGSQGNDRNWRTFEDFDGSSQRSHGNGRGSRGNGRTFEDFDGSSQRSYGNGRGSRGNGRTFEDFDGSSQRSYGNRRGSQRNGRTFEDFDGSSQRSYGNDRGSQRNGRGSRGNDRNWQRYEDRERGRGQFNKYDMDEKDFGEFRNSRRVIER